MKLIEIKVMRGANYWSNYRKQLIVMKLDLEELEEFPSNKIDGFAENLKKLLPSLQSHRCSEKHEGGFFKRVEKGTWMGHIVEHIALEIQSLAGMNCGYGRTRSTNIPGVYHVVFSYELENAGLYAAKAAIRIAEALVKGENYDLNEDVKQLSNIFKREGFGPSTLSLINEAHNRNIPFRRLDNASLILFGQGIYQRKIRATVSDSTSSMGVSLAQDKKDTKDMLAKACVPVPKGMLIYSEEELSESIEKLAFPLAIKPVDGNHGNGITINITTKEKALEAFKLAKEISDGIIVEEFINGSDFRFLVINFKLVAVAKRTPACITGDGRHTILELIDEVNNDENRGDGHEKILTKIKVDSSTELILQRNKKTLNSILPEGEIFFLKETANLSTGGTSQDVTDLIHPYNRFLAERIAKLVNLDICGIDVVASDVSIPLSRLNGGIVEVNAGPGLRMHLSPSQGLPRNVSEPIMEMLFPKPGNGRIPLVAVTGTNGKTTTTRLIAHLARQAGHKVGYTTTDGTYIQDYNIQEGDCTGPVSAETVLTDPTIDFAVLECARGGILRSGLGFDNCDISIITNITVDHLGLKDIHTLKDMAKVKGVVAQSTHSSGFCILNADDDLVYSLRNDLDCNIALFSIEENNERVTRHCQAGGMAAIIENGYFVICKGQWKIRIDKIDNIPLSFSGRAACMIKNILPSILAATIQNFSLENIRKGLLTFIPSAEQTPGRMNIFKFKRFELMIDYAHNVDGFRELKKFLDKTHATEKIGIISVPGDRRDEDIIEIGGIAADMFTQIIIRHDSDMRGRNKDDLTQLLIKGIKNVQADCLVKVISEELDALQYAIDNAPNGSFVTLSTDHVQSCITFVNQKLKEDESRILQLTDIRTTSTISATQSNR